MTETKCDACHKVIAEAPFEVRESTGDWSFEYDTWELCSVECLGSVTTQIAIRQGGQREHDAVMSKVNNAPEKFKKWWNR